MLDVKMKLRRQVQFMIEQVLPWYAIFDSWCATVVLYL